MTRFDKLTKKWTAFNSFTELLNAKGGYFPSLNTKTNSEIKEIADFYDKTQEERGDSRRAYRW